MIDLGMREAARPSGGWMLAHARAMSTDPLRFLTETSRELGSVVEFPIPRQRVFFVDDPQGVQRVLRDNHRSYGKRTVQYDALSLVTGQGLLTADFEVWRPHRRLQQPAYHHSSLVALADTVVDAADRLLARWDLAPSGSVVDVDDAMMRTTLEVVGRALFSADLGGVAGKLVEAVLAALDEVIARARNPASLPLAWPSPGNRRLSGSRAILDTTVGELVAQRRAAGTSHDDLLGLLLDSGLPDEAVRDEVVTTVVAGHETVASAMVWVFDLLGRHPDAQQRVGEEVDSVLGVDDSRRAPTWADYPSLTWTRQVVDETLRLFPPAWVITRQALDDDVLAGVTIPRGALVIMCPYSIHRRRDAWPDPERFDPERFGADRREAIVRDAYLPFGTGPRLCIGREFALLEATLLLARVSQHYALRPARSGAARRDALVTIRPHGGQPMILERRS